MLSWEPASSPGSEQRVVVSLSPDGLQIRALDTTEPLPPDQSSIVWRRLTGQANHYWWVLTLHPDGWVPSERGVFEGPTCVADFQ